MGHTGDYFPAGYRVGAYPDTGEPNIAHNWVEGMLLYYLETGDRFALTNARRLLDDLTTLALQGKYFSNGRNVGWHLIHLTAGAAFLREPKYFHAAQSLVRLTLERQRGDGSWRRVLNSDHCTCWPQHTGNTGFMIGILIEGLVKYGHLTQEKSIADSITRAADFLMRDMYDKKAQGFRYTSCPAHKKGLPGVNTLGIVAPVLAARIPEWTGRAAYERALPVSLKAYFAAILPPYQVARKGEAFGKTISKALRVAGMMFPRK